ncbi:MAG: hypothetical protein ABF420_06070 [Acetobacter syzygii]|uniref:hypothetical protein n=1 Tax=Acetobacter syzygii TaxID=146476 RepID=UPI0039E9041A
MSELLFEQAKQWATTKKNQGASIEQVIDALYEAILEILPDNDAPRENAILLEIYEKLKSQIGQELGEKPVIQSEPISEIEWLRKKVPATLLEEGDDTYFSVCAAGKYGAADWVYELYFVNLKDAKEMFELLVHRYGCVRLYEWAKRTNQNGNTEECWLSYWWSDSDWVGEEPSGRGWGIPWGNERPVAYAPLKQLDD